MILKKTTFFNCRNLVNEELEFDSRANIFYGKNGQGKTSILEAIYFNITGTSFRTKKNQEMIKYNHNQIKFFSYYEDMIGEKNIAIAIRNNKKEYYYNKKKVKYDDFIGKLNVISFIPEDISLITGTPTIRRNFFDYEISQSNYDYYLNLKKFNKILKTRNHLLKTRNTNNEIFKLYNEELIEISIKILQKRLEFTKNLSRLLNLNYRKLFDINAELKIKYESFLGEIEKENIEELRKKMLIEMEKVRMREKKYGYSLIGPQKDKYVFTLNEKDSKLYSSQGEKKSIVFAIKISEIDMIVREKKEYPIFLLDDISSYFDSTREEQILEYFKKKKIQIFITSTEKLEISAKKFYVKDGEIDVEST